MDAKETETMAELDQQQEDYAQTKDELKRALERLERMQQSTTNIQNRKRSRAHRTNAPALYDKLLKEVDHQARHHNPNLAPQQQQHHHQQQQQIQQQIKDNKDEQKKKVLVLDSEEENKDDGMFIEEERTSQIVSKKKQLTTEEDEEDSERTEPPKVPKKKDKLKKYFSSKGNKKPTKGGGLQKMMEGNAIKNPLKKLKYQAPRTNNSNNREEQPKQQKQPETTTMNESMMEELKEELKQNNAREIKKDNAFYGITVHIMDFLNRLTAASSWSTNPANTKTSIHKMTRMIESFPIPVESEKHIKLTELLKWKSELEKVTSSNERSTKITHKEISKNPSRKEWDSSTTVPQEKPLKIPKSKAFSTLTSPTGGSGIDKSE